MQKGNEINCEVAVCPATLRLWVNDSWEIARKLLWSGKRFSQRRLRRIKQLVSFLYLDIPAVGFHEFAAERYHFLSLQLLRTGRGRFVSPERWFDPTYPRGLYSRPLPGTNPLPISHN